MDKKKLDQTVRDARAKILRQRRREIERLMQDAMLRQRGVEAKISRLETEKAALARQVAGLQSQIAEIDNDI